MSKLHLLICNKSAEIFRWQHFEVMRIFSGLLSFLIAKSWERPFLLYIIELYISSILCGDACMCGHAMMCRCICQCSFHVDISLPPPPLRTCFVFSRLFSLFNGFNDKSKQRLPVYSAMVKFAGHVNLMSWIPADVKQVPDWWNCFFFGYLLVEGVIYGKAVHIKKLQYVN